MDGDQAWEALIGEAQAFHEEQQLRRAARVLDHVVEFPPAQDVDVTLAEKRVWRERGSCQAPASVRGVSVGQGTRGQSDSSSRHREISTSRKCHRKGVAPVIVPALPLARLWCEPDHLSSFRHLEDRLTLRNGPGALIAGDDRALRGAEEGQHVPALHMRKPSLRKAKWVAEVI